MPRVKSGTARASKKTRTCLASPCVLESRNILPGQQYYVWTFRYGGDQWQHQECGYPKRSQLTQSKMSQVYSAIENAEPSLSAVQVDYEEPASMLEGINNILSEAAGEIRAVSEEYAEAAEAMGGAGAENEERASALESWADDLESFDPSVEAPDREEMLQETVEDGETEIDEDAWHEKVDEYLAMMVEEAIEKLSEEPI